MTKLKSASDWATERVKDDNPKLFELFIADIQKNAIEAALEVAQADVRNKLSPISNLLALMNYSKEVVVITNEAAYEIVKEEKSNCQSSVKYLSESITSLINHKDLKL